MRDGGVESVLALVPCPSRTLTGATILVPIGSVNGSYQAAPLFWPTPLPRGGYRHPIVACSAESFALAGSGNLTDRIILTPFAAKRLAILLNNLIREHENRFGQLAIEAGQAPTA